MEVGLRFRRYHEGKSVSCSTKEGMWLSSDVAWRPSIDFSVFARSPCQSCKKFRADLKSHRCRKQVSHPCYSWMGKRIELLHMPTLIRCIIWNPWLCYLLILLEIYVPQHSNASSDFSDKERIVKCSRSGSLVPELFTNGCAYASITRSSNCIKASLLRDHLIEEPWLGQPLISHPLADESDNPKDFLNYYNGTKTYQHDDPFLSYNPVEEPWMLELSSGNEGSSIENNSTELELNKQHQTIPDLFHKEESKAMSVEDYVSTVILINSSICTMQRIAVLENNELVELLLEPVKNNVQCDSVYVGLVTKLVPHMGGAFVNIGSTRLAFMDLNPKKEPFILRPFHGQLKERENRTTCESSGMESDFYESMAYSGDKELDSMDDDQSEDEFTDERPKDNENISHADFAKVINENVNGIMVGLGNDSYLERLVEPLDRDLDQLQSKSLNHDAGVKVGGVQESASGQVRNGSKIIVQVVKEGLGTKGPTVTPYPKLRSRFWVLMSRCNTIGISKKISGLERTRLRAIAKTLQPPGFGLTVRTVASGHSLEELQTDLEGLLSTWKSIVEHAKSAALAADEGVDGAVPVLLHRAMGQTLSVVQDYFNEKVKSMIVDSPRTYHEVTKYLQDIAPNLCDRVELYHKRTPLFDEYNIEAEINNILSKRVHLANGGSLVIEQTEALVSIDVNGGQCMLGQGTSQEKAILEVNLVAAKQIARELRLRDIGGIIVVDFIDMVDDSNKRLVYEEVKKAVERDRSTVKVSELSRHGLMEITRKRVRPSVTFMISEPCPCCHGTGRVEALETSFSKIEHEICRLLSTMNQKAEPEDPKSWPRFILRVDRHMCNYLTSGKKTRLAVLSSSLKVWILLKVARGLSRGAFELKSLTDDSHKNQHPVALSILRPKEVVTYAPSRDVTLFPIKKWKIGGK